MQKNESQKKIINFLTQSKFIFNLIQIYIRFQFYCQNFRIVIRSSQIFRIHYIISKNQNFVLQNKKQRNIYNFKRFKLKNNKSPYRMKKLHAGLALIFMMLGHNYVINQPQSMQTQLEQIHKASVTQFNLLYSIPSFLTILTIIPIGYVYNFYPNFTIMLGVSILFFGQLLVSIFGAEAKEYYFSLLIAGRTFQATGAQVLYMIQGNLASSWMGSVAGLVFVLPQFGQIINAFLTPYVAINWGVKVSFSVGLIFCFISFIASWYLFHHLRKRQRVKLQRKIKSAQMLKLKQIATEIQMNEQTLNKSNQSKDFSLNQDKQLSKNSQSLETHLTQRSSSETTQKSIQNLIQKQEPKSIFKAGKIFWLMISLCAVNQCLYFPFLDNANQLIQLRFKIPYEQTGYFLGLPFLAASKYFLNVIVITTLSMSQILNKHKRKNLILYTSVLPFIGHLIILVLPNCQEETLSIFHKIILALGFFIFGSGIGGYYSVSFSAVGMQVPKSIRGFSYGVLGFFQTLAMSLIPLLAGMIIQQDVTHQIQGYKHSSIMFVILTMIGMIIALVVYKLAKQDSFGYDDQDDLGQQEALEQEETFGQKINQNSQTSPTQMNDQEK